MYSSDSTNQVGFNHLCGICQNLFNKDGAWAIGGVEVLRKHHNINDLIKSAKAGCHFCVKIVDDVKGSPGMLTELLDEYDQDPIYARSQITIKVHSNRGYRYLGGRNVYAVTVHKEIQENPVPRHNHWQFSFNIDDTAYPNSHGTSSQQSWEQLGLWIRECTTVHGHCVAGRMSESAPDFLPARLVDVGQTPYETPVRLCDGRSLPKETEYVTLSHCWGKKVSPKLLKTNYSRFYGSIPQDQLSRTFADAVEVTRRLGKRYLWIDALCIIQDSKEDWNMEASMMGEVYSRSYLNIAATASADGQGGLFRTRDPLSITPCRIIPAWEDFSREPLVYFDTSQYRVDIEEAPLNQRAWVVQERLLAPRAVHFTNRQLYWECAQLTASESLPWSGLNYALKKWTIPRLTDKDLYRRSMHLFETWNNILEAYTQCDLTVSSDKLVAISGVAQNLKYLWGDESVQYHAGIWSFGMIQGLLWQTSSEDQTTTQSKEYRAPSWSWASVDGRIYPSVLVDNDVSNTTQVCRAQILEVKLSHPISDFGAVNGGYLRIRGPLARMTCKAPQDGNPEAHEHRFTRVPKSYVINGNVIDQVGFFKQWDDWSWSLMVEIHADTIYLMALESRFFESPVAHDKLITGLLLRPTKINGGQYERLGCFSITASKTYDLLEKVFASESISDDLVLAGNRTAGYTIEII